MIYKEGRNQEGRSITWQLGLGLGEGDGWRVLTPRPALLPVVRASLVYDGLQTAQT